MIDWVTYAAKYLPALGSPLVSQRHRKILPLALQAASTGAVGCHRVSESTCLGLGLGLG